MADTIYVIVQDEHEVFTLYPSKGEKGEKGDSADLPNNIAFTDVDNDFTEDQSFADGKSVKFDSGFSPGGTKFNELGVEFWEQDAYWRLVLGGINILTGFGGSEKTINWGTANDNTITFGITSGEVVVKAADKIAIEGLVSSENDASKVFATDGSVVDLPSIIETADTGTVINLSNVLGNLCNMASANGESTYTPL